MRDASSLLPALDPDSKALPEGVKLLLDSATFEKAPALRALLTYLWQNRHAAISEYAIATEALGRTQSFDARTDATVRVQISRLRQRLEKFYEKEGAACAQRLVIPLGTHQVEWEDAPVSLMVLPELAPTAPRPFPAAPEPRRPGRPYGWLAIGLVAVCIAEGILLYRAHLLKPLPAEQAAWFWRSFFSNGRQTRIALPTPIFFWFRRPGGSGNASIMFRDTEVNDFSRRALSPPYLALERSLGQPTLAENYTVTSDTFASVQLARYLDHFALTTTVTSSADAPLEALDRENLIALGTWGTLTPLRPYLDRLSFELGPHENFVDFRNPAPGEPKRVDAVIESPERGIWPGVIALLPGNGGHTHLLILASRHTAALVSFLTSTDGLRQLEKLWRSSGSPPYFEVVVNAELSGRGLVRTWPVALHPYKNKT
jgi:hypothetical protein